MEQIQGVTARTKAFVNLYAVLGTLEELCRLDEEARALIDGKTFSIGFRVAGGPCAALRFGHGACALTDGDADCDIRLAFPSPEKFNAMIDGTANPIPIKGFTKLKLLTKTFVPLTDILTRYLRASQEDLKDPKFFEKSTTLMFYTIAAALSQIGNHDKIARASAGYIPDGTVCLRIHEGPAATVAVRDHLLQTVKRPPEDPSAVMEFTSMAIARDLFEGRRNSLACIGVGEVRVEGMMLMLDNLNRILDRVGLYLA